MKQLLIFFIRTVICAKVDDEDSLSRNSLLNDYILIQTRKNYQLLYLLQYKLLQEIKSTLERPLNKSNCDTQNITYETSNTKESQNLIKISKPIIIIKEPSNNCFKDLK